MRLNSDRIEGMEVIAVERLEQALAKMREV